MIIEIEPTSDTPIYLQIMHQIKHAVVRGDFKSGASLPSVRVLASDLGINMHTINKAYNLLVDDAVLVKSQKGYMIQEDDQRQATQELKEEMKNRLETIIVDAYIHQVPEHEIDSWTETILKKLKKGEMSDVDI